MPVVTVAWWRTWVVLRSLAPFQTVYCSRCGAGNPPGSTYCSQCGGMLNP